MSVHGCVSGTEQALVYGKRLINAKHPEETNKAVYLHVRKSIGFHSPIPELKHHSVVAVILQRLRI